LVFRFEFSIKFYIIIILFLIFEKKSKF